MQGLSGRFYVRIHGPWASVDGVVKNNSVLCCWDSRKSDVYILDSPSKRRGNTCVHIRGKLRLAAWRRMPEGSARYYVGHQQTLDIGHPQYHDQFAPVLQNPTLGPEAHALCDLDGTEVGYFIPDTEEDLTAAVDGQIQSNTDSPLREIFCLQIIARPLDFDAEEDFAVPWAVRGLALVRSRVHEHTLYRRVGYIELSRDHPGMDTLSTWPGKGKNRSKRPFPELDGKGFFQGPFETTIEIC